MRYSLDEIYRLAGRDDKVAVITLCPETTAFAEYGEQLTVAFHYDLFEREKLEHKFRKGIDENIDGVVKVTYLGDDLEPSKILELLRNGVNSTDIQRINPSAWASKNLFYNKTERNIKAFDIKITKLPKGGDYDWMYGFNRRLIHDGVEFSEYEMNRYLGMKYYYEPDKFTKEEKLLLRDKGVIKESIEKQYLEIKLEKEVITATEEKRLEELLDKLLTRNYAVLKKELNDAGTNINKLYADNPELCFYLISGTLKYNPERLNGDAGKPVYLDWQGYLHVFIRHVEAFSVTSKHDVKDKFRWHPQDVEMVIGKVIQSINSEIQEFWKVNPVSPFSKYGDKSLFFEGDYYTFHIEPNGRLSTFHRTHTNV